MQHNLESIQFEVYMCVNGVQFCHP